MGVAFDGDGDRAIFVDANGRVVDGDAVLLMCGRQHEGDRAGSPATRRRDRDEQHRPRDRAARERHRADALPGRRQVRDGGDAQARLSHRRRAVGPRHLLRAPVHRRRHRDGAQRAAGDGRDRPRARGPGVRAGDLSADAGQRPRAREEGAAQPCRQIAAAMDRVEDAARRPGPAAGALLGHRAAAAGDDRGEGPARDPGAGRRRSPAPSRSTSG